MIERVEIIQDLEILIDEYLHKLEYNLKDPGFTKYFTERTGYCKPLIGWPDPLEEPDRQHRVITQCKLQDCWEIWGVKKYKGRYWMDKLMGRR